MKKIYFFVVFVLSTFFVQGQSNYQAPTLSVGADAVSFKKGTLDVELLTKIIAEKQREIVREGIKRVLINHIIKNEKLDDFTQFYIERITNILFEEKNHKVITKRILEESTNYLFVLGTTKFLVQNNYLKLNEKINFSDLSKIQKETLFRLVINNLKEIKNQKQSYRVIYTKGFKNYIRELSVKINLLTRKSLLKLINFIIK